MANQPAVSSSSEQIAIQLLRFTLVVIFLVFGIQKFTLVEAEGIAPFVTNSPLTFWLNKIGTQGASMVVGTFELAFGLLLAVDLWRPASPAAIFGAIGSCVCFMTTLSFLLTTPGIFAPDQAPILSVIGLFLLKDIVLLSASFSLLTQSWVARQRMILGHMRAN